MFPVHLQPRTDHLRRHVLRSPFLWMLLTAFKSDQDVFHSPPRWLPYDNVRVDVNGEQLPLYNVKTEQGDATTCADQDCRGRGDIC